MLGASRLSYLSKGVVASTPSRVSPTITASNNAQHYNFDISSRRAYGNSAMYFDGTGDVVTVAPETAGDQIFSGAFTFEFWFWYDSQTGSASANLLANKQDGGTTGSNDFFILFRNYDQKLQVYCAGDMNVAAATDALASDTWHHVALVRDSSGNLSFYTNGSRQQNVSGSSTAVGSSGRETIGIGAFPNGALPFNSATLGYIDEVRVTATAKYDPTQSSITVPTGPVDPDQANDRFLLHMDNTAETNTVHDDKGARRQRSTWMYGYVDTIPPGLQNDQSKWGTSSLYCNGSTNAYFGSMEYYNSGSNDFTIETWFYPTSSSATQVMIASQNNTAQALDILLLSGTVRLYMSDNGSSWNVSGGTSFGSYTVNAWNHVALVRNGNTLELMLNGTRGATVSFSGSVYAYENNTRQSTGPGSGNNFNENDLKLGSIEGTSSLYTGYISDTRISDNARYTGSSYTMPSAAHANDANTVQLVSWDGADNSKSVKDINV